MSSSPPLVVADRYRLIAPLGQGGMGRVWRATDVVLHREVAIKELVPPPGLTPGERQEMRERSLREARAIARLNNINVVRVFDVLSTDADPWIVMEYVASRSLQDTLAADGPFNALRTAEIGLGVLNALRAAHRNGVMHRDVKPGNVLLGADGRVVLTDFGLATVPGDPNVTRTGLVLGSPAYIAPERARDGTAGPAADLWSLGATLYAAVEGASPFARPSAIATLAALATENVPVARNAGPLKPVLNGLLRKDPAHRINAEEAERLLSRAAGRRGKITFPMSPTMRRPGVGRERPSLPSGPGGPPVLPGSGWATATGSAPVVPNPRPPVAKPAEGRPPHFAAGKAQVGGTPPEAPRRGGQPLDPTRLDTPPVKDDLSGTGDAPPSGEARSSRPSGLQSSRPGVVPAGQPSTSKPAPEEAAGSNAPTNALRTGFTAADVAANRRKQAAPEHERSLAQATSGFPVVTPRNAPAEADKDGEAQATTVMPAEKPVTEEKPADAEAVEVTKTTEADEPETATAEPETVDEPVEQPAPDAAEEKAETPEEAGAAEAADKADEVEEVADDRTSVVAAPAEKTSLLLPAARPRPAATDDDKTSVVAMPPRRRIVTATEPATQVVGDLTTEPGFSRPSRPAWTPMQMRPVARRTGGITILGTTLTRRQAAIGLGIVLTFLLLVGIIVVQAFGDDDTPGKDVTQAGPGASAPVVPGGGKSEAPKPSDVSSPSPVKPTSAPPSPSSEIPAGWRVYNGSGYSFWVPESVSGGGGGTGTTLDWGNGRQIRIDLVPGKNDPVEYLRSDGNTGYRKVGPTQVDFNGVPAADLEYYRSASGGTQQRVLRRVFVVKNQTYVLTWYTVADDWEAAKADREKVFQGFKAK
ncbi:protein kinase [Actinoplanes subglobosus]|uniref:non-specific serine/threonine protein kinase n=1 Tax=Actinoplanes subglobosus TaxID=1547892 RepID=A0ABV8IU17_9ACTN